MMHLVLGGGHKNRPLPSTGVIVASACVLSDRVLDEDVARLAAVGEEPRAWQEFLELFVVELMHP